MTGNIEINLNRNVETELEGNIRNEITAVFEGVISRGIKACRIDDDGHLIFTLTDDAELDIGKVTGEDGVSITGISTQASSVSGGDNIVTITLSDGSIASFTIKNGAKGDPGKDGHSPIKGIDYYTSSEIEEIKTAVTPVKGRDYFDGAKGDPGDDGYTPRKNIDYFDGQDGTDGIGITNITVTESTVSGGVNIVTITLSDGTQTSFQIRNGTKGESGEGSGDMSASMYDPQGKRTDIYRYTDDAIAALPEPITSWDDIEDKPSTFPPSTHTHSQYLTDESDPTVPSWAKEPNKPTYTASEVGALPDTTAIPTESTVSGWGFTKNTGTYSKPSTGIPKTDLASTVQASLGKADTALQSFTETDPVFMASPSAGITADDITKWNEGGGLPSVTTEDNGKSLIVTNGEWTLGKVFEGIPYTTAENYSASSSLKPGTSAKYTTLITLPNNPYALKILAAQGQVKVYQTSTYVDIALSGINNFALVGSSNIKLGIWQRGNNSNVCEIVYNPSNRQISFYSSGFAPNDTWQISLTVEALYI